MKRFVFFVCCLCYSVFSFAQGITGGVLAGATTSQINGDGYGGFYNIGLTAGGYVEYAISHNLQFRTELRFTQKGAGNTNGDYRMEVGYVELPFVCSYQIDDKIAFYTGIGAGFRIYEYIESRGLKVETNNFGTAEIPWFLGGEYHVNQQWYVDLRSAFSLLPIDGKYHHWCLYAGIHYYLDLN
ncbi:MAG: outer membrane beta-barrel protein [Bacteroidales bacterium]|jgi:opacity protein-like surface antigen|nr:outer membrane beta-barrel protein [Bacteroidales bacterium]